MRLLFQIIVRRYSQSEETARMADPTTGDEKTSTMPRRFSIRSLPNTPAPTRSFTRSATNPTASRRTGSRRTPRRDHGDPTPRSQGPDRRRDSRLVIARVRRGRPGGTIGDRRKPVRRRAPSCMPTSSTRRPAASGSATGSLRRPTNCRSSSPSVGVWRPTGTGQTTSRAPRSSWTC